SENEISFFRRRGLGRIDETGDLVSRCRVPRPSRGQIEEGIRSRASSLPAFRRKKKGVNTSMQGETSEINQLLRRASEGDSGCWQALMGQSRGRLHRMVAFRLDQRLQGRVDPSDVLQDAYLEACQDLDSYMREPAMPFFLWLRGIAGNKLR